MAKGVSRQLLCLWNRKLMHAQLFGKPEWDTLLLQYVLPALATHLRDRFQVNPRDQKLEALQDVLAWRDTLRPSMLSQLLEAELIPKWLMAAYAWLVATPNFTQVRQWCARFSAIDRLQHG